MSDSANDGFDLSPPAPPGTRATAPRLVWYLPTNQLNLMYLLAAGLVTGPRGFGRKYYVDALSVCPGWIPLFAEAIPQGALDQAVTEAGHLRRVVAALDLSHLKGPVQAIDRDGNPYPLQFPDGLTGGEQALMVPAPLPATWIQTILFASKEARAATEEEAADFANVPLAAYKRQVNAKAFAGGPLCPWPPALDALPTRDEPIRGVAALGGTMGLLFALGNIDDSLVDAGRRICDPSCAETDQESGPATDPLLAALDRWACLAGPMEGQDIQGRLLLETLHGLVDAKVRADQESGSGAVAMDLHQRVLNVLASEGQRLAEDKWLAALERLTGDLRGILGLGADSVSELLTRHTRPFSRGLILFFLREGCEDLLAFRQPRLTGMDYVTAAALFGARSGWMGLPPEVRGQPGLRAAVTHRMAALAQRRGQSGLDLGPAPAQIQPIRALLGPVAGTWNKARQEGALKLARGMGWDQVLRTRISLGKGDYRLQVDGRGAHILLDGEVKATATEIDREGLLARLAEAAIPAKLDAQVRSIIDQ